MPAIAEFAGGEADFCRDVYLKMTAVLLVLTAIKLFWNFLLPYALLWECRRVRAGKREKYSMSFPPPIEIPTTFAAALFGWLGGATGWTSPEVVLVFGLTAIVVSYLHLPVVIVLGGLLLKALLKPPGSHPTP